MHSMKTTTKTAIRSTDELWQWAALKRSSVHASRSTSRQYPRESSQMAQGILSRFYAILRETCITRR